MYGTTKLINTVDPGFETISTRGGRSSDPGRGPGEAPGGPGRPRGAPGWPIRAARRFDIKRERNRHVHDIALRHYITTTIADDGRMMMD